MNDFTAVSMAIPMLKKSI
ncbi:hypothetical protein MYA98_07030 [Salmonella sp. WGH-01]|nr:hypothetical protein MYA98_07030 [Salmonella sp. WGH-01]